MAQQRDDDGGRALVVAEPTGDDLWDSGTLPQVDLGDDLRAAVRRATGGEERLIVADGSKEVAAIIPIEDLRLLVRLEEEELNPIDVEEIRRARQDPANHERIPLEWAKTDLRW